MEEVGVITVFVIPLEKAVPFILGDLDGDFRNNVCVPDICHAAVFHVSRRERLDSWLLNRRLGLFVRRLLRFRSWLFGIGSGLCHRILSCFVAAEKHNQAGCNGIFQFHVIILSSRS